MYLGENMALKNVEIHVLGNLNYQGQVENIEFDDT